MLERQGSNSTWRESCCLPGVGQPGGLMRRFWTVLAAGLSLPATVGASEAVDTGTAIQAKQALVAAALTVREARFHWETAEALVHQAESGLEAARIQAQQADERGAPGHSTARAVAAAQRNW